MRENDLTILEAFVCPFCGYTEQLSNRIVPPFCGHHRLSNYDITVRRGETNIYKVSCYLPGATGKNISRQTNYPTVKLAMNALEDLVRNWVKLASLSALKGQGWIKPDGQGLNGKRKTKQEV